MKLPGDSDQMLERRILRKASNPYSRIPEYHSCILGTGTQIIGSCYIPYKRRWSNASPKPCLAQTAQDAALFFAWYNGYTFTFMFWWTINIYTKDKDLKIQLGYYFQSPLSYGANLPYMTRELLIKFYGWLSIKCLKALEFSDQINSNALPLSLLIGLPLICAIMPDGPGRPISRLWLSKSQCLVDLSTYVIPYKQVTGRPTSIRILGQLLPKYQNIFSSFKFLIAITSNGAGCVFLANFAVTTSRT